MKHGPVVAIVSAFGLACAAPAPAPAKTQLQTRQFQTRAYDTKDSRMVFKAVLNVLQDENFVIKILSQDLGFVTATREIDNPQRYPDLVDLLLLKPLLKSSIEDCNIDVSEFGDQVRVRVACQVKRVDTQGTQVANVDDPAFYQQFFAKVDKGIFLHKEKL